MFHPELPEMKAEAVVTALLRFPNLRREKVVASVI